jgi:hypothetical protein
MDADGQPVVEDSQLYMNAKKELLDHIGNREVKYIHVTREIQGTLTKVLSKLDFEYDNGFGTQELAGTVWYSDGTWSERAEYGGSEWWVHRECPLLPRDKLRHGDKDQQS